MDEKKPDPIIPICTCVQDPFANLPSGLRPKPVGKMGGLRKVTCPGCGLAYWTNRKTDVCIECEKKGIRLPEMQKGSEMLKFVGAKSRSWLSGHGGL